VTKKKPSRSEKTEHIELGARLSIAEAVELHRRFTERVARAAPIIIDGSRVEEIDTAILQLLVSLWLTGEQRGVVCRWHAVSDALRRLANIVGVAGILKIDIGSAAHEHAVA
jgi:anti-anti-sigma regulatory factor